MDFLLILEFYLCHFLFSYHGLLWRFWFADCGMLLCVGFDEVCIFEMKITGSVQAKDTLRCSINLVHEQHLLGHSPVGKGERKLIKHLSSIFMLFPAAFLLPPTVESAMPCRSSSWWDLVIALTARPSEDKLSTRFAILDTMNNLRVYEPTGQVLFFVVSV